MTILDRLYFDIAETLGGLQFELSSKASWLFFRIRGSNRYDSLFSLEQVVSMVVVIIGAPLRSSENDVIFINHDDRFAKKK